MPRMQECPAIKALREIIHASFPDILLGTTREGKNGADRHTSGLAIDIHFDTTLAKPKSDEMKAYGLAMLDLFVKHFKAMQWGDILYRDIHIGSGLGGYSGNGQKRGTYSGKDHYNHIHIDWVDLGLTTGPKGSAAYIDNPYEWSSRAKNISWRSAFEADVKLLASNGQASVPNAAPAPSWLVGWWKVAEDGTDYYYYFAPTGSSVVWTDQRPSSMYAPPAGPKNQGTYVSATGRLTITWRAVGGMSTVETFAMTNTTKMNGSSNRGGPLTGTHL